MILLSRIHLFNKHLLNDCHGICLKSIYVFNEINAYFSKKKTKKNTHKKNLFVYPMYRKLEKYKPGSTRMGFCEVNSTPT